jgi:hypothetical protein
MKVKDLKKDTHKSVRINSDVSQIITNKGYTLQSFLDEQLEKFIDVKIEDAQSISEV